MRDSHDAPRFEGAQLVVGKQGNAAFYDAKFLISVLLVYVAKGDGHIDSAETNSMIDIISKRFDSSGAEAMGLLSDAVKTILDGGDLVGKLRQVSQGLSAEECSEVFALLLEVITADGELADGEARTAEVAGKILGLSTQTIQEKIRAVR